MMISTKGRYALRVMIELARRQEEGYVSLKEVAQHQGISEKYLEAIMKNLVTAGLAVGLRGKGGGYQLSRPAADCSAADILRAAEGSLAPVACLEEDAAACSRMSECRTLPLWQGLNEVINNYLDHITLADLMQRGDAGDNYVI